MSSLAPHLPFPSDPKGGVNPTALPPDGSHLVISDTLAAPGQFAVYNLIAAAVAKKRKVVWVDLRGEGRASLEAILRKMSVVLPSTAGPGGFIRIAPSSLPSSIPLSATEPALFDDEEVSTLNPTWQAVVSALGTSNAQTSGTVVILDGLSQLISIGIDTPSIGQFVRVVLKETEKSDSILISTVHVDGALDSDSATSDLLARLKRIATGWWRIDGLSSGRSADVHGEISSFPLGPQDQTQGWAQIPRSQPLQYRLEPSSVKVFAKGTSRGYL